MKFSLSYWLQIYGIKTSCIIDCTDIVIYDDNNTYVCTDDTDEVIISFENVLRIQFKYFDDNFLNNNAEKVNKSFT